MKEMQVWSLGQEDPLEEGMTTHSSILAWRIPWTEEPGRLQSISVAESWTQLKWFSTHTHTHRVTNKTEKIPPKRQFHFQEGTQGKCIHKNTSTEMFTETLFQITPNWLTFPSNDHQTITWTMGYIPNIYLIYIIMLKWMNYRHMQQLI